MHKASCADLKKVAPGDYWYSKKRTADEAIKEERDWLRVEMGDSVNQISFRVMPCALMDTDYKKESYSLVRSTLGGFIISRQDADHKRTVALVGSVAEWGRFVAALDSGLDEIAAVGAIDQERVERVA